MKPIWESVKRVFRGNDHTTPVDYEIAAGFTGWAVVEYAVLGAPPLPIVDGNRVVRIPASGYVATSSPQEHGIVHDRYFIVDEKQRRTPIENADDTDLESRARNIVHPRPVVCCCHYGSGSGSGDGGATRYFSGFYVGTGPAGETPRWPV